MLLTALLLLTLLLSVITDLRSRRIPNTLTLPLAAVALLAHTVTGGWTGFLFSFEGLLLGLALLIIPFAMGWMGGGDVKLLAAVGAVLGPQQVFIVALYMAVVGGVIAAAVLGKRHGIVAVIHNLAVALRTLFIALIYGWKVAFPGGFSANLSGAVDQSDTSGGVPVPARVTTRAAASPASAPAGIDTATWDTVAIATVTHKSAALDTATVAATLDTAALETAASDDSADSDEAIRPGQETYPYAVAIAIGTLLSMWVGQI